MTCMTRAKRKTPPRKPGSGVTVANLAKRHIVGFALAKFGLVPSQQPPNRISIPVRVALPIKSNSTLSGRSKIMSNRPPMNYKVTKNGKLNEMYAPIFFVDMDGLRVS